MSVLAAIAIRAVDRIVTIPAVAAAAVLASICFTGPPII